jgi:hypothetical protein
MLPRAKRLTCVEVGTDTHHITFLAESILVCHVLPDSHVLLARLGPRIPRDYMNNKYVAQLAPGCAPRKARCQLTGTINVSQSLLDAMCSETGPVRHKKDATRLSTNHMPVWGPSRAFKRRHKRLAIDCELGRRVFEMIDDIDDLFDGPVAGCHAS